MAPDPGTPPPLVWDGDLGRRWVELADLMDVPLEPYGLRAMDALALQRGIRVLDVGCGCGATTLELARRVGDSGLVVGVDISTPMVEMARERAATAGISHARFEVADAARAQLDGPFDAVFSRFGVMFFEKPVDAFANIRRSMRRGARLGFVCWQARSENPWNLLPYEAAQQVVQLPAPPGPRTPGGAAFAEPEYVQEVLGAAGFAGIQVEPFVLDQPMAGGTDLDAVVDVAINLSQPIAAAVRSASPDDRARVADAIGSALGPFATDQGYCLRGSTWIVSASG
jgi:SAM-dependent methyltransferase